MKTKTSIICAVYSKDPNRSDLIKNHYLNLKSQSVDVEPIYIFENSDSPPPDLGGEIIISNKLQTIYEAWNLGLSACRTPLVMNLNLDDRLNLDAIELLERTLINNNGDLIGGDWKICYSQDETDDIENCYAAERISFLPSWPPMVSSKTRLGSGTGERGTYGPSTMWKLSTHIGFPRYPYRTTDDYRIKGVADSLWWNILKTHLNKNLIRLPSIIGNYFSHPDSQAEFRVANEWDLLKNKKLELY